MKLYSKSNKDLLSYILPCSGEFLPFLPVLIFAVTSAFPHISTFTILTSPYLTNDLSALVPPTNQLLDAALQKHHCNNTSLSTPWQARVSINHLPALLHHHQQQQQQQHLDSRGFCPICCVYLSVSVASINKYWSAHALSLLIEPTHGFIDWTLDQSAN